LHSLSCQDSLGTTSTLDGESLAILLGVSSLTLGFNQTGAGDTSAPILASFYFWPTSASTLQQDQVVTVVLGVTDDVSGVQSCSVNFAVPRGQQGNQVSRSFTPSSQGQTDVTLTSNLTFPRYSRQGVWYATSCSGSIHCSIQCPTHIFGLLAGQSYRCGATTLVAMVANFSLPDSLLSTHPLRLDSIKQGKATKARLLSLHWQSKAA
jgi:hypothetical protein